MVFFIAGIQSGQMFEKGTFPFPFETTSMKYKRNDLDMWHVCMVQNYWILQNGSTIIYYMNRMSFCGSEREPLFWDTTARHGAGGGNQQRNLPGWQEQNVRALRKHPQVAVLLPKVEVENNITVVRWKDEFRLSGHMIKSTIDVLVHWFLTESCRKICMSSKKEFSTLNSKGLAPVLFLFWVTLKPKYCQRYGVLLWWFRL